MIISSRARIAIGAVLTITMFGFAIFAAATPYFSYKENEELQLRFSSDYGISNVTLTVANLEGTSSHRLGDNCVVGRRNVSIRLRERVSLNKWLAEVSDVPYVSTTFTNHDACALGTQFLIGVQAVHIAVRRYEGHAKRMHEFYAENTPEALEAKRSERAANIIKQLEGE